MFILLSVQKNRKNQINEDIQDRLFDYIGGTCKGLECYPIQVGGYQNHVHILCQLSNKVTQTNLIKEIKVRSSVWIKTISNEYKYFYWQDGYGVFSINTTQIEVVRDYIINQKLHHNERYFKDEFRLFLKKYNINYDERYVWD